jgi:hypothetical protein
VHDEDPFTQAEAEELLGFVELYLTYVYTLPDCSRSVRRGAWPKRRALADNLAEATPR